MRIASVICDEPNLVRHTFQAGVFIRIGKENELISMRWS